MSRPTKASLLLFFFSLCAAAIYVTLRPATEVKPPVPRELYSVVNEQLAAFRAEDFPGAYRCSASAVQQKFTLRQFEAMIRHDYSQMANARRVEFGTIDVHGSTAFVQVFFFAWDGSARSFLYSFAAEKGIWKIDGAQEVRVFSPRENLAGTHA